MDIDGPVRRCVGCSHCCVKSQCAASQRVYGIVARCPALFYQGGRYWCRLCYETRYREELAIGAGCCCGLNSWRDNIPPPPGEDQ